MFSYLHLNDWAYIRFCSPISERVEFHVLIYDLMWSLYSVLSFCFHHFLLYIWKSLLPLCPNYIVLLEWKSPDFLFRNAPSIRIPQPKIRSLLVCDQFSPSTFLASALLHLFVYNFMCRTWSNNVTMQWREMVLYLLLARTGRTPIWWFWIANSMKVPSLKIVFGVLLYRLCTFECREDENISNYKSP